MRRNLRKILLAILILLALFALAYRSRKAMHVQDFSFTKLVHAIAQANGWLILLGLASIYSCYAIRSLRWNALCRHLGHTTFLRTFAGTLEGFASIFILGRAGDPVRPLLLARKDRLPASSMFGIYVLERLFDFASYVGLFTIGILVFPHELMDAGVDPDWIHKARRLGWSLLGLIVVIIIALVYFRLRGAKGVERRIQSWQNGSGFREKCAVMFNGFSQGMQAMSSVTDLLVAIGYSAVHWALVAFAYFAIARAFGDPLSSMNYPGAMLLLSITLLGSILQLPGVGGGAQVASIIALTQVFGVDQEAAVVVAVVLWLITFAAVTVTGIPLLIHEGWSIGDLRRLAKEEAEAEKAGRHVAVPKPSHPHGKDPGNGESSQ